MFCTLLKADPITFKVCWTPHAAVPIQQPTYCWMVNNATDLGERDIDEHSRITKANHTQCQRCGRAFDKREGSVLIIPPDFLPHPPD